MVTLTLWPYEIVASVSSLTYVSLVSVCSLCICYPNASIFLTLGELSMSLWSYAGGDKAVVSYNKTNSDFMWFLAVLYLAPFMGVSV